jgi:hypothetical protein
MKNCSYGCPGIYSEVGRLGLACKKNEIITSKSKLLFRHALITKTFLCIEKIYIKRW